MTQHSTRVSKGVPTGGQFAASVRSESGLSLAPSGQIDQDEVVDTYADGSPRPYVVRETPQVQTLPDGTEVKNYLVRPVADEDGIFAYGNTTPPEPSAYPLSPGYGEVPPQDFAFSGSVGARDGRDLMRYSGMARSRSEQFDRIGQVTGPWAEAYDRRPGHSNADQIAAMQPDTRALMEEADAAKARRLAVADRLNAAVTARLALPKRGLLPSTRAAIQGADLQVAQTWGHYKEAYPDFGDGRRVLTK